MTQYFYAYPNRFLNIIFYTCFFLFLVLDLYIFYKLMFHESTTSYLRG